MLFSQNSIKGGLRGFLPAELRHVESLGWFIEYHLYDLQQEKMVRYRIKLNVLRKHCATLADFKLQANVQLLAINNRLAMIQQVPMRYAEPTKEKENAHLLLDVLRQYMDEYSSELRRSTLVSYRTFVNQFSDWIRKKDSMMTCDELTPRIASEYMEFVQRGGNNGGTRLKPRTYNNNLKFLRIFSNWCVSHSLMNENVFEKIKAKRELPKARTIIPAETRQMIREYFEKNNPQYLIICQLVFTALLRPIEISRVQVKDVDLENKCIHMPSNKTKTYYERDARLSDELVVLMNEHIRGAKPSDYLFADKKWLPGAKPMSSHTYGNVWAQMRKELHLPEEMQLYSLRDTAINGMLKAGVDSLSVMQAADHHDLTTTTRYANHTDNRLIDKLNEDAPDF